MRATFKGLRVALRKTSYRWNFIIFFPRDGKTLLTAAIIFQVCYAQTMNETSVNYYYNNNNAAPPALPGPASAYNYSLGNNRLPLLQTAQSQPSTLPMLQHRPLGQHNYAPPPDHDGVDPRNRSVSSEFTTSARRDSPYHEPSDQALEQATTRSVKGKAAAKPRKAAKRKRKASDDSVDPELDDQGTTHACAVSVEVYEG